MLFACIFFVFICLEKGCLPLKLMASIVVSEDGDIAISVIVIVVLNLYNALSFKLYYCLCDSFIIVITRNHHLRQNYCL